MMIDFGKFLIFKRQITEALHRLVGRKLALANLFEQFADGVCVHVGPPAFAD